MEAVLVVFLILASGLIAVRALPSSVAERLDATAILSGPAAPWVVGVLTTLLCGYVWGHLHPTAVVHDEASYLLQARIFAQGAFAMPARPLPEFFEQFHTYVTPSFASKYPPGHALLMAPGVWFGMPSLMPLLLDGVTGALIFLLAHRIMNPWVGIISWLVWITPRATFTHLASYYSQSSSGAIWLLGWWALLSWRDSRDRRWLFALAACVGWLAITRPLTALAYSMPVGIVVLVLAARRRAWRDVTWATVIGAVTLLLIPYANLRTTGDWRVMPYSEYSKIYFPFDAPGFGLDTTPPRRALPADMVQFGQEFRPVHVKYTPDRLGGVLLRRFVRVSLDLWGGPRAVLFVAALAAIPAIGAEVGFALASTLALFVFYLSFAHDQNWTLYYSEVMPVLAFLSASGLWRLLTRGDKNRSTATFSDAKRGWDARPAAVAAVLVVLSLGVAVRDWRAFHRDRIALQSFQRNFGEAVAKLPEARTIVFIRYAPWHILHFSLIANDPDLESSHAWLVYDRGADNESLRRLAPSRTAYLFDEQRQVLIRQPTLDSVQERGITAR